MPDDTNDALATTGAANPGDAAPNRVEDTRAVASLAATEASESGASGDGARLDEGATIGRYKVQSLLGAGGMGIVYRAHDPELGRLIALKIVRPTGHGEADARARFVREAQAMARIVHPNVITVHDVGTIEDQMFVAMELVDGEDLGAWEAHEGRTWREIAGVYLQAARGLAAAHDAGLVHRDFKPANTLVGKDGRVRVLDFGLARATEREESTIDPDVPSSPRIDDGLTQTGSILGTPRYMAPEQHRGELADARTDQYSFCVALYHALYRRFPHEGSTYADLSRAVVETDAAVPPNVRVPNVFARTLRRGLARKRIERFSSMHELIAALEKSLAINRRGPLFLVGAAALVVAVGIAIAVRARPHIASVPLPALFSQNQQPLVTAINLSSPDLSPDEKSLVYLTDSGLEFRDLVNNTTRVVADETTQYTVRWSPHGDAVAVASEYGIQIFAREGSTPRLIPSGRLGNDCVVAWAPDAESVLWRCPGDPTFTRFDVASGTGTSLPLGVVDREVVVDVDWQPAGIVVATRNDLRSVFKVFVASLDGLPPRLVATAPFIGQARWGEGGRRIHVLRRAGNVVEIVTVDPARPGLVTPFYTESTSRIFTTSLFAITRDAKTLYFVNQSQSEDIATATVGSNTIDALTNDNESKHALSLSPDGAQTAFAYGATDIRKLFTLSTVAGSAPRDVGLPPARYSATAFSPDGTEVAFIVSGENENSVNVVTLASGVTRKLPASPSYSSPYAFWIGWSRMGIHVIPQDGAVLLTIDPRSGATTTRWASKDIDAIHLATISTDGKTLAVAMTSKGVRTMAVVDQEGKATPFRAYAAGSPIGVSANGEWIYLTHYVLTGEQKNHVTARRANGDGTSRLLATIPTGAHVHVMPDESRVIWVRTQARDTLTKATTTPSSTVYAPPPVPRPVPRPDQYLPAPSNLALVGAVGEAPTDWQTSGEPMRASITDRCGRPGQCVALKGAHHGTLFQRFDAAPFRGKRVRVSVELRVDGKHPALLRVDSCYEDGTNYPSGEIAVNKQGWTRTELVADVEPDARYVELRAEAIGEVDAWIGPATFSPVTAP